MNDSVIRAVRPGASGPARPIVGGGAEPQEDQEPARRSNQNAAGMQTDDVSVEVDEVTAASDGHHPPPFACEAPPTARKEPAHHPAQSPPTAPAGRRFTAADGCLGRSRRLIGLFLGKWREMDCGALRDAEEIRRC